MRLQKYLVKNTRVPTPKIYHEEIDPITERHLLYMEKMQGVRLADVWDKMDNQTRENVATQMVKIIEQLSTLTEDRYGGFFMNAIRDEQLFMGMFGPRGPFSSHEDIFEVLVSNLDSKYTPALKGLAEFMPDSGPPTLTHGDLHMGSIMVRESEDGWRIVAVLGWDHAAFSAVWWESVKLRISPAVPGAGNWLEKLRDGGLPAHDDAERFMNVLGVLRDPDGGDKVVRLCEALVTGDFHTIFEISGWARELRVSRDAGVQ
jgi:hypothetical protein